MEVPAPLEDVPELPEEAPVLDWVELELLDEQAASSTAPLIASAPNATRAARGLRLLIPKCSMHPRIYLDFQGRQDRAACWGDLGL